MLVSGYNNIILLPNCTLLYYVFSGPLSLCAYVPEIKFNNNNHCLFIGIEGAFDGQGSKTVIPRKVIGKFSIRLVPDMDPDVVKKLVTSHIEKIHKEGGSPNDMK